MIQYLQCSEYLISKCLFYQENKQTITTTAKKTWVSSCCLHVSSAVSSVQLHCWHCRYLRPWSCSIICHNFCSSFVNRKCLNVELPFKLNWEVTVEVLQLKCYLNEAFLQQIRRILIVKAVRYKVNYDSILSECSSQSWHNQQNGIQPSFILLLVIHMLVIQRHVKISAVKKTH